MVITPICMGVLISGQYIDLTMYVHIGMNVLPAPASLPACLPACLPSACPRLPACLSTCPPMRLQDRGDTARNSPQTGRSPTGATRGFSSRPRHSSENQCLLSARNSSSESSFPRAFPHSVRTCSVHGEGWRRDGAVEGADRARGCERMCDEHTWVEKGRGSGLGQGAGAGEWQR